MKTVILSLTVNYEEDLIARVAEAAQTIRQKPGIFERTRQSLLYRCRLFIEVGGLTFEHVLLICITGTERLACNHEQGLWE
jgi:hypothetical protein